MNTTKIEELNQHFLSVEKQNVIKINETLYKRASNFISFMNQHVISLFICVAFCSVIVTALLKLSLEYSFLFYSIFSVSIGAPVLIFLFVKNKVKFYNQKNFYCLPADKETMVKFVAMYDDVDKPYLECIFLNNNNVISYNIILKELNRNMGLLESKLKKEKANEIIESLKNTKSDN